ncbi:uncharacterized protein LOC119300551 [Triticum dicoccoides]|uniref:uncharacterized protein LOC119300551 n=1 Tax=Triticum dicoccoides TaxID=85692 RepID=UPI001890864B|nr:uncharacterized protein LOC119300551 [Triticum dicoccoides]
MVSTHTLSLFFLPPPQPPGSSTFLPRLLLQSPPPLPSQAPSSSRLRGRIRAPDTHRRCDVQAAPTPSGGCAFGRRGQHDPSLRAASRWVLPPNGKGSDGLHFPRWPAGYGTGGVKPSSSDASTLSRIELALSRCLAEGAAPTCHRIVVGPRPSAMASSPPIFSPTLEL